MRRFFAVMMLSLVVLLPAARAEGPDEDYVGIYALILQADTLDAKGNLQSAHAKYAEARAALVKLKADNPDWNVKAVKYRLSYLTAKLAATAAPAPSAATATATTNPPVGASPTPADSTPAGEPVEMKLKWEVGKRYVQRMDTVQATEMNMPGSPQPMKQEIKQTEDVSLSALSEREGGGRVLEMEILGMTLGAKAAGQNLMSFDSQKAEADDAANPAAPMLRKMVGLRVKFLTDAAGKIEKVEGFQEAFDRISKDAPAMLQGMLKGMFSEDNFKEMYSAAQGLPDKPVKIGDAWPIKLDLALGPLGSVILSSQYTFKGWEQHDGHKCAVLEFTGTISAADPGADAGGMTIGNGKTSGKTWFDPAMGMVIDSIANQSMTIKVSAQGQSFATKVNGTVGNKLVKVTDAK